MNFDFNLDESEIEALKIFGGLAEGFEIEWALVKEPFVKGGESGLRKENFTVIVNKPLPGEGNSLWRYGHTHLIETGSKVFSVDCFFPANGYQDIFSEALAAKHFVKGIPVLTVDWFLVLSFYVVSRKENKEEYLIFELIDRQTLRQFRKNMIKHFGKTAWGFARSGYKQNRPKASGKCVAEISDEMDH